MWNPLLSAVMLPLAGMAVIWILGETTRGLSRWVALATSLANLALVGHLIYHGQWTGVDVPWFGPAAGGVRFSLALDGLSVWLFGLSALLSVTAVLVSWNVSERPAAFFGLLLLLETGMLGVFAARDIILFYVFFEFTLIPLFFLIGVWGSEERRYAAIKFFLFTLAGSVLTFLGLLSVVVSTHGATGVWTFSIAELTSTLRVYPLSAGGQLAVFLALFAGFAIKVPLFPLHTWLPLAHVQAPTAGSVLLAGVLLKIGAYGFLRFSLPMLPDATAACTPWILWLSVAGIIYGALVALAQSDMKRLIAYSSVSHLGFCLLGIFALNKLGLEGGVLQLINHGLSTGGLFAVVGMIYERYHTREISRLGGLARRTPLLAVMMVVFTFSSIGLPGLNGFAGEFLLLTGMFQRGWQESTPAALAPQFKLIAVLAVSGVVLGAWYMLWLVERVFFGPVKEPEHHAGDPPIRDLSPREALALAPLIVFVFWIGLRPQTFLEPMRAALTPLGVSTEQALIKHHAAALAGRETSPPAAPIIADPSER